MPRLSQIPKSFTLTSSLPADTNLVRTPRQIYNAFYVPIKPAPVASPKLLATSSTALKDLGITDPQSSEFLDVVSGNQRDDNSTPKSWSAIYGGHQFGVWAGQLGDGRVVSLFEMPNYNNTKRYELQLKGSGITPFSRFANGLAARGASIREFIVSEALSAMGIESTRALSIVETGNERAIVARFAESWLRIGSFELPYRRADRKLLRSIADYALGHVFPDLSAQGTDRYLRLYEHIVHVNALAVARWQVYGFVNGVLNTDNTSILGLAMDFGPFGFVDTFDAAWTPNSEDFERRYAYGRQPTIIWWNLVRLGEALGELIGSADKVDDQTFIQEGTSNEDEEPFIAYAEKKITETGEKFKEAFTQEYVRLFMARLGLPEKENDLENIISPCLDALQECNLDFHYFFRQLSNVSSTSRASDIVEKFSPRRREDKLEEWLELWLTRARESTQDEARQKAMKAVNPNFVARNWILQEAIDGGKETIDKVLTCALSPFQDAWDCEEAERWTAPPKEKDCGVQCSCSS